MTNYTNDFGIPVTTSAHLFESGEAAIGFMTLCKAIDEARLDLYYEPEDENDILGDHRWEYKLEEVNNKSLEKHNKGCAKGYKVVIVDSGE